MFVSIDTAKKRYEICKNCERFQHLIKTCSICNCFMPGKVILAFATCPQQKWQSGEISENTLTYTFEDYK